MGATHNRESSKRENSETPQDDSLQQRSTAEPAVRFSRESHNAKFWIVPTAEGSAWVLNTEPDAKILLEQLKTASPIVYVPALKPEEKNDALACAGDVVHRSFRDKYHAALFSVSTRMLIGFGWLLAAVIGLKIPGEVKFLDEFLLLGGIGFCAYSVFRYGFPMFNWQTAAAQAPAMLQHAEVKHHPLLDRFASALKLRKQLKAEERGHSPDAELLDVNAYRKLINEGVTTIQELSAIADAVTALLQLENKFEPPRTIAELARECGLDAETAIFYRDLAAATRELKIEYDLKGIN